MEAVSLDNDNIAVRICQETCIGQAASREVRIYFVRSLLSASNGAWVARAPALATHSQTSEQEAFMGFRAIRKIAFLFAIAALGVTAVQAQTDVAASFLGAYGSNSGGNGLVESPSDSGGGLFELRHIVNPLVGFEGTYSYNRANEVYDPDPVFCPVFSCIARSPAAVSANAHEVTGDWVVSLHLLNLRPFALAGVGLLVDIPSGGQAGTKTATEPLYDYGLGVDWGLLPHIGLRLQYRSVFYKAPDLTSLYPSSGAYTHTDEPTIGVYFRL
jgi:hypothetical protein